MGKLKPLKYNTKVLMAWGEAISGNKKMRDWLIKNGYKELGIFCFALNNKDDARLWLMKNGYAHLFALINGSEGNESAIDWLDKLGFKTLAYMARFVDRDNDAMKWLIANKKPTFAVIAQRMRIVKDNIDDNNHDPHKLNFS